MNSTSLKDLLEAFVATDCKESEYPSELDDLLSETAKTGTVKYSWQLLKPLLKYRLESVLRSDCLTRNPKDDDRDLPQQLSQRLDTFNNPPFTIQRLCELVMYPKQHYKSRAKYMRAMEKNLMVVSTQEPDSAWMKSPRLAREPATTDTPNHNHTPNHYTSDGLTSSAAESCAAASADQHVTHPSHNREVARSLSDMSHYQEGTRPSQGDSVHREDREVMHPPSDHSVLTRSSPDQEVTHPSSGQEVTCPSHGQEVTRPSHGPEVTHPSHGQEVARPSHGQEVTRPSHGSELAHSLPGQEVAPSLVQGIAPSINPLPDQDQASIRPLPNQEVTRPSLDSTEHKHSSPLEVTTLEVTVPEVPRPSRCPLEGHGVAEEVTKPLSAVPHPSTDVAPPLHEVAQPLLDYHSSLGLPRKRNLTLRDSLDASGRGTVVEQDVMGLVLQEADSTTIEHSHLLDGAQEGCVAAEEGSNGIKVVGGANAWGRGVAAGGVEEGVKASGVEDVGMKRGRYLDVREGGEALGGATGANNISKAPGNSEGIEEVGGADVEEATRKQDLHKEEATGQVEPEAQSNPNQLQPGGVEEK